jgi:hypothetical protein
MPDVVRQPKVSLDRPVLTEQLQVEIPEVIDRHDPMSQPAPNRRLGQASCADSHNQNVHPYVLVAGVVNLEAISYQPSAFSSW